MKNSIRQLGLAAVAKRRWQSYANVDGDGGARLSGMQPIPAHSVLDHFAIDNFAIDNFAIDYFVIDNFDSLATNSGEPMT